MAERMAARIWIGGKLSADLAGELCSVIGIEVFSEITKFPNFEHLEFLGTKDHKEG